MTLRDSSDRNQSRKGNRTFSERLRSKLRRKERRLLTETLEQRQLLAGPDLIAIQPNDGEVILDKQVRTEAPRELVFRFDDQTPLDASTIADGIRITRAGSDNTFETASAITDFGTNGTALAEFRALQPGSSGEGIRVELRASDRGPSTQQVLVDVNLTDRLVTLDLNSNASSPSSVRDVLTAVSGSPQASSLIEAYQISGSSLNAIGDSIGSGIDLDLIGANAAEFISDLGTNGQVSARFVAASSGSQGVGTQLEVSRIPLDLDEGQLPYVSVSSNAVQVILDSTPGKESTAGDLIAAINSNVDASGLITAQFQSGNLDTVLFSTAFSPLVLVGATDTLVEPGYVGLGETSHEVVFRFSEPLPQDTYQIEVFGTGPLALKNIEGEAFADGENYGLQFSINNAPKVAAVVPNPVRRQSNGTLVTEGDVIEVYFDEDIANPTDAAFYELIYTRDTATNLDDVAVNPTSVTYDSASRMARLTFESVLSEMVDPTDNSQFLSGAARLRVGGDHSTPQAPSTLNPNEEPGDSFSQALALDNAALNDGVGSTKSLIIGGSIENQIDEYSLQFPGGPDVPGVRSIRPEDPARLDLAVPLDVWREGADEVSGITTVYYDFPDSWKGDDPESGLSTEQDLLKTYLNVMTEQQKDRVREALSLYSEYLGLQFVEASGVPAEAADDNATYMAIAAGELYGAGFTAFEVSEVGGVTVATRPLDQQGNTFIAEDPDAEEKQASGNNLLVMDFQDFDGSTDDLLGGEFFRGAMLGVGQLLGYGYAEHLPQPVTQSTETVLSPGSKNEAIFPSPSDVVNGQYLYRPESNDIDLYKFTVENAGEVSIQTIAERMESASSLDTALRLYQNLDGVWTEIAANDDYFSKDSLIEISLDAGEYIIGVSSSGNTDYDPVISNTGIGGRTEGNYDLRITFAADGESTLVDHTQVALDGDMDGEQGGDFNYWFLPSNPATTTYVDSDYDGPRNGLLGSINNPYSRVSDAIDSAGNQFTDTIQQVRVIGGTYTVGLSNLGVPLDGSTLELPKGVQLVVDAGTTFKMSRSRIGVGSTTEGVDRSQTSIQVLGVPNNPVLFTSASSTPNAGDWGGIDIRADIDSKDGSKVNPEDNAVFYNHIQYAEIEYGGGAVSVDGNQVDISPIELASTRPTIINTLITQSGDAAIAATPDSFEETRFDEHRYQRNGLFTPDVERVGPHIRGNTLTDNTINGVLFRIQTPSGADLNQLSVNARLDDVDVVHVLTENLVIEGGAGGPDMSVASPDSALLKGFAQSGGEIEEGSYVYKLTYFNSRGYETSPSESSSQVIVAGGNDAVLLSGLPTLPSELVDRGFVGRRLYRASVDLNGVGEFREVADLKAGTLTYLDTSSAADLANRREIGSDDIRLARFSSGLKIDPGAVIKAQGSRIELTFGAHLFAEGTAADPIIMTSVRDVRYGAGGTLATMASDETEITQLAGDWSGIYAGFGASVSLDHTTFVGGGGASRIEGGFGSFNPLEIHQSDLRVTNSRFEDNADGRGMLNDPRDPTFDRVGRTENASGTIFVRGSQPIVVDNDFVDGNGPALSFDVNSFTWWEVVDSGRSTGRINAIPGSGNSGPLVQGNRISATRENSLDPSVLAGDPINRNFAPFDALGENTPFDVNNNPIHASLLGMEIRGGEATTNIVLDDVDIVHIVRDTIEIPNQHIYGGMRLESDARGSLVMKFQNQDLDNPDTVLRRHAGIVVGGNLITAEDQFIDIEDRIGGSLQIVGHPDFPVVMTSLMDDTVGAGFTPDGRANYDTDNNGFFTDSEGNSIGLTPELAAAATGTWDGITIREAASDQNVLITTENEPRNLGDLSVNDPNRFKVRNEIPGDAQFLGEIANDVLAGDNVRRTAFIVEGTIAKPGDLDVYSFIGEAGTQIWLDVDRTNSSLDTVVELIDANGNIRVLSDDSLTESQGSTDRLSPNFESQQARSMETVFEDPGSSDLSEFQDLYSTNPRDAGMRLVLPGSIGQRFLYHVRVRSNNSTSPSNASSLLDPGQIRGGMTSGAYQLQIRLQETDVSPGTQVRFSDVRFAQNGVEIIGGPISSPILSDEYEKKAPNDTLSSAQRLGLYETAFDEQDELGFSRTGANGEDLQDLILQNPAGPLSSDRLAKGIAGFMDSIDDADWYEFDIKYPQLTRDTTVRYLSTIFDIDYSDGLARTNTSLYVFDAAGNLVLMGTDSNVADDQLIEPGADPELSRGSYDNGDPFIGAAELSEGTYFVAVTNQLRVPPQLNQYFQQDPDNPLLRLEPIDSIDRIVEDRIESFGGGTASDPETPILFDANSIVSHSLDDVVLYINSGTQLWIVNPKTGERYLSNSLGEFSGDEVIRDVAFRANGELFGYTDNSENNDEDTEYVLINTADAVLDSQGEMEVETGRWIIDNGNPAFDEDNVGVQVEAITIRSFNGAAERGYLVGNRSFQPFNEYSTNILMQFDPQDGSVIGGGFPGVGQGAGLRPSEVGQINTTDLNNPFLDSNLGIGDATFVDANGIAVPRFFDGDQFTVSNVTDAVTFELDQSVTLIAESGLTVSDGDHVRIDDTFTFEFNTANYLRFSEVAPVGQLNSGTTVSIDGSNGTTLFEFVDELSTEPVNVEIELLDEDGEARSLDLILADLTAAINENVEGVTAVASADLISFTEEPVSITTNGAGVQLEGGGGVEQPGAIEVTLSPTDLTNNESVIQRLADAIRSQGIPVSNSGTQLSLPSSGVVTVTPVGQTTALQAQGAPGVALGNVPIQIFPTDNSATIANRISTAIQSANDNGDLPGVSGFGSGQLGRSVQLVGGFVTQASDSFTIGGSANGGLVTGVEMVGGELFAVSNAGGLYRVSNGALSSFSTSNVGNYVKGSTDLRGINFSGLRAGPMIVENGALSQVLFGVTSGGDIHAFNTSGELLPVFAGGKSVISTGIAGAAGLDFGVVDYNLWHVTEQRDTDEGHGINETFNGTRPATEGGSSLAFNYENSVFGEDYPAAAERPTGARLDGTSTQGIEGSYNAPGGAKGVVQSNSFSLEGYSAEDLPMLYFNYFAETEAQNGLDALRVYVVTEDGVEHLVTTNNLQTDSELSDDEFDDPNPEVNTIYDDNIDTAVQPLFDVTGSVNTQWRQVRVPLDDFAGKPELSLRVEFATAGTPMTTSESMRVISGNALTKSTDLEFVLENNSSGSVHSFFMDLAPTISFPSGKQIAGHYESASPDGVVVSVDGQEYLLSDGSQVPDAGQIVVDLLGDQPAETSLADLSASTVASIVANAIQSDLPSAPEKVGIVDFGGDDDQATGSRRNDLLFEATALTPPGTLLDIGLNPIGYTGGNITINGQGRFGNINPGPNPGDPIQVTHLDDVDLLRVDVLKGTRISVQISLDNNEDRFARVRFFDSVGNELLGVTSLTEGGFEYTAEVSGTHYIGLSGDGNTSYDPRIQGSGSNGLIDSYTSSVTLTQPANYQSDGSLVEFFGGQTELSASPAALFDFDNVAPSSTGTPVKTSRFMSVEEIGLGVQEAVASNFLRGQLDQVPTDGPFVRLPGLTLRSAGPFVNESERYLHDQDYRGGVANNAFEGIYLDDFVVGFAERGELATGATPIGDNVNMIPNGSLTLTNPPQLSPATETGAYQLEIRDGSEYVSGGEQQFVLPEIQRFAADPIVITVYGKPYGFADGSVPGDMIIPAIQRPLHQVYELPTADVLLNPETGLPIAEVVGANYFVTLDDGAGTQLPLIELDGGFTPVLGGANLIATESRFRTFNTNDRLSDGYSVQFKSAADMVDGDGFAIFGSLNQLEFEFDIRPLPTSGNPNPTWDGANNPAAVVVQIEASDSASEVNTKVIAVLNSPAVKAALKTTAVRSNATLLDDQNGSFLDDRMLLYGDVRFEALGEPFESVTLSSQRGDANRDRSQQGTIIIENNRFLFSEENGVSIVRSDEAALLSEDANDEFPVALVYPSHLIELNSQGIVPGVVVQNNVVGFNGTAGIHVTGINNGGGAITTPVGFDMIVNNTIIGGQIESGVDLGVEIFQGVTFEHGGISFADAVDPNDVTLGLDADFEFTDVNAALGSPDGTGRGPEPENGETTLSLGTGGRVVFQFVDNLLTGNDSPTPDLVVFETGASESVSVEISRDGVNYYAVGVASGLSPYIDIDAAGYDSSDRFGFVRLTDLATPFDEPTPSFGPAGADIDAVGALSTVAVDIYTAGGEGIVVTDNSGPTLLNNVLANLDLGINVAAAPADPNDNLVELSKQRTVLGGNAYYRNLADANGSSEDDLGVLNLLINSSQPIFTNPTQLVFAPSPDVPIIDSSIDSLEDRASLRTVRGAVGLPAVPLLAPIVDMSGQIRVDDPMVNSPTGFGENVFKDRGANERTDSTGPRITLITPRAQDLLADAGQVVTSATIFDSFEVQIIDGIAPADPGSGVGVDDVILNNGALVRLSRLIAGSSDTEVLVEGVDYRYAYDASSNTIRFTPIAGVWQDNAVYTIDFLGSDAGVVIGKDGSQYGDGQATELELFSTVESSQESTKQVVEIDTGIGITVASTALTRTFFGFEFPNIQGQSLEVFDGYAEGPTKFELTTTNDDAVNDAIIESGAIPVRVGQQANASQIAAAIASAINQSEVKLFATAVDSRIQLRDSVIRSTSMFDINGVELRGVSDYLGADVTFSTDLRGLSILGQTFSVFDGENDVTFTMVDDENDVVPGTLPVLIASDSGRGDITTAMKTAIEAASLDLAVETSVGVVSLRGLSDLAHEGTALAYAQPGSLNGDPLLDAFKLTNYSIDATLTQAAIFSNSGVITIFDGSNELNFEFDSPFNPGVQPGNIPVNLPFFASSRQMMLALKTEVDQSGLDVDMVVSSRGFRLAGRSAPVGVVSETDSVDVTGLGAIGTSPGFGIGIPANGLELDDSVEDEQTFTISRGPITVEFELDFDQAQEVEGSTLVSVFAPTLNTLADAMVAAINASPLGLTAENVNAGRITLSGDNMEDVSVDVSNSTLTQLGSAGQPNPVALVMPLDAEPSEVASAYQEVLAQFEEIGVASQQVGDRVIITTTSEDLGLSMRGISVIEERVSDKVGNQTASEDLPPLVIYMGGGFDYGDAPEPYASLASSDGPRHFVDEDFALWRNTPADTTGRGLTYDNDARLPNADEDNGIRVVGSLQPGFGVNLEVGIYNVDGRDFYLDAWFDWNADGIFEESEAYRFGSAATGRSLLNSGSNIISVMVPADAALTEIYARFRLSEQDLLGPTGVAGSGEVEDVRLEVSNNPYRNPADRYDVNNSGLVTPLDALQVVNAISRNGNQSIFLDDVPLPADLPIYPDVSGDGVVSTLDALQVINELSRILNGQSGSGEGEWVEGVTERSYGPEANGVLASTATALSQRLGVDDAPVIEETMAVEASESKTSIFDDAASVQLDSIVDSLAADNASVQSQSDSEAVDDWFSSL